MPSREEILSAYPLADELDRRGVEVRKGWAICPFHADSRPSLHVQGNKWTCFVCDLKGQSVVDFIALMDNRDAKEVYREMAKSLEKDEDWKLVEFYRYTDAHDRDLYFVDRLESGGRKKFSQWHKDSNGNRVKGISGVERTLYRMPRVVKHQEVYLVEGEKCVHALENFGYCVTTNSGGSSAWQDGYADLLRGKKVTILPDSDPAGKKWEDKVLESIKGKALATRLVHMPEGVNDIADLIQKKDWNKGQLEGLFESSTWVETQDLPIYSSREVVERYRKRVQSGDGVVDLSLWLPSLKYNRQRGVRSLFPGDVVVFVADTGVGKTAVAQNIAIALRHMTILFVELELPQEDIGERFEAIANRKPQDEIEDSIMDLTGDKWDHVWVMDKSSMSIDELRDYHLRSELKIGKKPEVIMIDYIGLMNAKGGSKYEKISEIADDMKRLAKDTETVVIVTSQSKRTDRIEVELGDARDSGNIEQSGQAVFGCWRPENDTMIVRINKTNKGVTGTSVECNFDGSSLVITERTPFHADH